MQQDLETRPGDDQEIPTRVTFFSNPRTLFRTYTNMGEDETLALIEGLVNDQFAAVKSRLINAIYEAVVETQAMIDRT
jgi:hypothetical protein